MYITQSNTQDNLSVIVDIFNVLLMNNNHTFIRILYREHEYYIKASEITILFTAPLSY